MQKLRAKRGQPTTTTACPPPSLVNPPLLPPTSPIDVLGQVSCNFMIGKDAFSQSRLEFYFERFCGRVSNDLKNHDSHENSTQFSV